MVLNQFPVILENRLLGGAFAHHQISRSSFDSQSPILLQDRPDRGVCITGGHLGQVKPDTRSLGSCETEITDRSGKLALYPVDLTKK